jgi:hypothetical protein
MKMSKERYRSVLIAAALAVAPIGMASATAPAKVEASIPFGLIRDWQADRERGMWIQAYSRKWYYAEFMGRCTGLNFATAVGFDTRFQSSFDRFSSVFVPGYGRCPIQTFTPSDGPPRKQRKADAEKAEAEKAGLEKADAEKSAPEEIHLASEGGS